MAARTIISVTLVPKAKEPSWYSSPFSALLSCKTPDSTKTKSNTQTEGKMSPFLYISDTQHKVSLLYL